MIKKLKPLTAAAGFALILPLAACEVTKTEDGEMPDIDVSVDGGNLPEYDVDGPDVDFGMKEVTVKVPDIDVTTPDDPDYEDEDDEGRIDENEGSNS